MAMVWSNRSSALSFAQSSLVTPSDCGVKEGIERLKKPYFFPRLRHGLVDKSAVYSILSDSREKRRAQYMKTIFKKTCNFSTYLKKTYFSLSNKITIEDI